jgi:hypothetical protein
MTDHLTAEFVQVHAGIGDNEMAGVIPLAEWVRCPTCKGTGKRQDPSISGKRTPMPGDCLGCGGSGLDPTKVEWWCARGIPTNDSAVVGR